jgi:hypothetical protein
VHGSARTRLSFEAQVIKTRAIKAEWAFIEDIALLHNIAYALQRVHFDILLVNNYNVYFAPEAMIFKEAIVGAASVAEAVLQYDVKLVEDDPRVKDVLGKDWVFIDYKEIPLPGVTLPDGQRAVTGLQRMVEKEQRDRNSKMQVLIRAARKVGIVDDSLGEELDELRKLRNRIHIKSLDERECMIYTAKMANEALDVLERFRVVAAGWTFATKQQAFERALASGVREATSKSSADDEIDFAPAADFGVAGADDDIPF